MHFDLIVVGGGPGGAKAAQVAARAGKKVALVSDDLGGECLNYGCIPSKTYLSTADLFEKVSEFRGGFIAENPRLDWEQMKSYKRKIVEKLKKKLEYSVTQAGAEIIAGRGVIGTDGKSVEVDGSTYTCDFLILAMGSRARMLPNMQVSSTIVTNRELLELSAVPQKLLIVGGGAIGVEFASIFNALGSAVTIVEHGPQLLPHEDATIAAELARVFERKKIAIRTGVAATEEDFAQHDVALIAIGRAPNFDAQLATQLGITTSEHGIVTNEFMQSSIPHIYAIGDLAGKALLAYTAEREGEIAVQHIFGQQPQPLNYTVVANTIFSLPEVGSAGLSEAAAQAQYPNDLLIGTAPFSANAKALILGSRDGLAKIIVQKSTGKLLGIHLIGEKSTELIAEGSLALAHNMTLKDLYNNLHSHPILGEIIKEACESALYA
ncbi:hypothetical protein COV82_04375 [Candidatus Peregrinibacteria bacterium CG11_big_fil_rev_8_21_14_0_20_46_8]|nr:MAG: hypothetical protein COV82_04375 [Candidatus Peregrinibacteria bacterium CG11_big_fil_rev_8_21_14_0_20_46_8]